VGGFLCPCGSGKKFKKCHGANTGPNFTVHSGPLPEELRAQLDAHQAAELQRQQQQGLGKPIITTVFHGYRFVAVGGRLLYSKNWKTFHDFLDHYIKTVLGGEWGNQELLKPQSERHPILVWYETGTRYMNQFSCEAARIHSAPITGAVGAYYGLAYNLYLLAHNVKLQEILITRLKNKQQFYGAYYETFVAGALIRAGFDVELEDETDSTTSHCELTATCRKTGRRFSVEAKIRGPNKASAEIGNQLYKALKKRANHSRVIFIEENLPAETADGKAMETLKAVLDSLRRREANLTIDGQPAPSAYVIVTNNPHEYDLHGEVRSWAVAEGYKISDFKMDTVFTSLREALVAREKHIEMYSLMRSLAEHQTIPCTFDGDNPELAFADGGARLQVGQKYALPIENGKTEVGELMDAVVMEERGMACGVYRLSDGRSVMVECPLTVAEMNGYRRHPDTFFGKLKKHARKGIKDMLDLYDLFHEGYRNTSKDRLLELMKDAPDLERLNGLEQQELSDIYAERLVNGFLKMQSESNDKRSDVTDGEA
jgi:SEC-C motif